MMDRVRCPLPRCGAENPPDAETCARCGMPVRGYARMSGHPDRLFNRGLDAAAERRFGAARDYFAAVVHWCPTDIDARNAYALAAYELGDVAEARRQWAEVQERRPDDPLAARGLSRAGEAPG